MTTTPAPRPSTANLAVLVVGTIAAVGCAFGPLWMVRLGLGIAVVMALVSTWVAWRRTSQLVTQHLAEVTSLREQALRDARAAEYAHHVESMAMIERFNRRKEEHVAELTRAHEQLAALRAELAAGALDNEAKQTRISALNKRVADLEKELAAEASPIRLPRRFAAGVDVSSLPLVYPAPERKQA